MEWLYRLDLTLFRKINLEWRTPGLDPFFLILSWSGLGVLQFLASLLLLLRAETRRFVAPLLTVIVVSGVPVAQGLKSIVLRERPSNLRFAHVQEPFFGNNSFPSGHTTSSFAVAMMLCLLTRRTNFAWVGPVALIWAGLVGISRTYRGVHWPTDVAAGALAGIFSACLVWLCFRSERERLFPG